MSIDPPAMNATEWDLRRELNYVTNDIAEDDYAEQAAGWRRIADAAKSRADQLLLTAVKKLSAS